MVALHQKYIFLKKNKRPLKKLYELVLGTYSFFAKNNKQASKNLFSQLKSLTFETNRNDNFTSDILLFMTLQEFRQRYQYDTKTDRLGEGGFAKVYKATDTLMKRTVALKFYHGDSEDKYGVIEELKKVTKIRHKNLVRYYDSVLLKAPTIYDPNACMQVAIIEYANAGDLNDFIKTFPSLEEIRQVVSGLLEGLNYLHEHGVIHRDIKPQNILLHKESGVWITKVADFGLAKKIEKEGHVSSKLLGTVEYMAPEQFDTKKYGIDGQLSTNLDLWALGIILFELFTGELPFGGRNDGVSHEQMMFNIMRKNVVPIFEEEEIIQPYRAMISWCLIKDAKERVQTANELIKLLNGNLNAEVVESSNSKKHAVAKPKVPLKASHKNMIFVGNVLLSPLFGLGIYFFWKNKHPNKAAEVLSLAWWSLAAWLFFILLVVIAINVKTYWL